MSKIAIIGAGVSGVAAAYYLSKNKKKFDIIEADDEIGGRTGCVTLNGKSFELGGKNIGYNYKLFREFVKDQGDYNYEYFGVNTSKVRNGQIIPINREKNFKSFINLFKLSSLTDLIKLFTHIKRIKKNPAAGFLNNNFYNKLSNRLDHQPLSSHFGKKCVNNIIRPMTVRMNGAEPEECYIGNFSTNIKSAFDKYEQLSVGMNHVLQSFCKKTNILFNTKVIDIEDINGKIRLNIDRNGKKECLEYSSVIIATPAYITKKLVSKISLKASSTLNKINYFPVGVAVARYQKTVFNSTIRAMVFDKNQPISNIGAYGINDLNIVRYTFSGKSFREIPGKKITGSQAIQLAEKLVPDYFNIKDNKRLDYIYHYWDRGLCAYSKYHHRNMQLINDELKRVSNNKIIVTGDYIKGVSIESCFKASQEVVNKLLNIR